MIAQPLQSSPPAADQPTAPYALHEPQIPLRIARLAGSPQDFKGCVWLVQDVQTKLLWQTLARTLATDFRLFPIIPVRTPQDAAEYSRALGPEQPCAIVLTLDFYEHVVKGGNRHLSDKDLAATVADLEHRYGFSVWRDMVLPDRHFGRGFTTGARGFPRSHASTGTDWQLMLEACLVSWRYWTALERRFPPDLVLCYASGAGIAGQPYARIAAARDIPFRNISYTRFQDRFYWADAADAFSDRFAEHYRATQAPCEADIAEIGGHVGPQVLTTGDHITKLAASQTWPVIALDCAMQIARRVYGLWRGYTKATSGYLLGSTIASIVRKRRHTDHLNRITERNLESLRGRKIIYLALQTEPETTTYLYSSHSSDQLRLVRECALTLPADAALVVKEHPWQVGHRDIAFYDEITRIPNVVFINPGYPSIDLVRRAAAVCTTSGSVAYQAAALGIPAFHCQERSHLDVLPHAVRLLHDADFARLRDLIRTNDAEIASHRRRDGARFYLAATSFGFATGVHGLLKRKVAYAPAELDAIVTDLDASLPRGLNGLSTTTATQSTAAPTDHICGCCLVLSTS